MSSRRFQRTRRFFGIARLPRGFVSEEAREQPGGDACRAVGHVEKLRRRRAIGSGPKGSGAVHAGSVHLHRPIQDKPMSEKNGKALEALMEKQKQQRQD